MNQSMLPWIWIGNASVGGTICGVNILRRERRLYGKQYVSMFGPVTGTFMGTVYCFLLPPLSVLFLTNLVLDENKKD